METELELTEILENTDYCDILKLLQSDLGFRRAILSHILVHNQNYFAVMKHFAEGLFRLTPIAYKSQIGPIMSISSLSQSDRSDIYSISFAVYAAMFKFFQSKGSVIPDITNNTLFECREFFIKRTPASQEKFLNKCLGWITEYGFIWKAVVPLIGEYDLADPYHSIHLEYTATAAVNILATAIEAKAEKDALAPAYSDFVETLDF